MRPLIGITGNPETNRFGQSVTGLTDAYFLAIAEAGGMPVLIPSVAVHEDCADLLHRLDGVLLAGGGDLDPHAYGLDFSGRLIEVHPARDLLELELARLAVAESRPILGICRGCQVLNVALGGTLYPDLPVEPGSGLQHDRRGSERRVMAHAVRMDPTSRVGRLFEEPAIEVNSHHHQGLRELGNGVRAAGHAPDGLAEAIELGDHPFALAVQWHPEWLTHQRWTRELFRAFVDAASSAGPG